MSEAIYIVDPQQRQPVQVKAVSFAEIDVKERRDLEAWVINHAEILGEPLLVVTTEFAYFENSSKRLDILALDQNGVLVVVELKLDAANSLADLQAIRYAAFCSTMTMAQVVDAYVAHHRISAEEAEGVIAEFLGHEDLPELSAKPRMVLAAGAIDDQELIACVLWLRGFGVDIRCVQLTPYRLPVDERIVLVPRVIIPLPEARDYMVRVEQKEVRENQDRQIRAENEGLWKAIGEEFNRISPNLKTAGNSKQNYMQVPVGKGGLHYEWFRRKREGSIDVAIHFETDKASVNQKLLAPFEANRQTIEEGMGQPLKIGAFGKRWTQAKFVLPYTGSEPTAIIAPKAAELMKALVDRTWPLVEQLKAQIWE